jgi:hypothetical protein
MTAFYCDHPGCQCQQLASGVRQLANREVLAAAPKGWQLTIDGKALCPYHRTTPPGLPQS